MINSEDGLLKVISENRSIAIFGAGLVGTVLVRYLVEKGLANKIYCVAVTDASRNANDVMGIPIIEVGSITSNTIDLFIIATFPNLHQEINNVLNENGIDAVQALGIDCYAQIRMKISDFTSEILQQTIRTNFNTQHIINRIDTIETRIQESFEVYATNSATFAPYENCNKGKEIVILATGPTLNMYKPIDGALHIGVNAACDYTKVNLDYYFAIDFRKSFMWEDSMNPQLSKALEGVLDNRINSLKELKCPIFIGQYQHLSSAPYSSFLLSESNFYRINAKKYFAEDFPKEIYTNIRYHPTANFATIVHDALNFALFTNPKTIYLVGCDNDYSGGHFNESLPEWSSEKERNYLLRCSRAQFIGFQRYKDFADQYYPRTEIISINPVGLKGLFNDYITGN